MSDHISGPRALADPIADITDVYAFPSPERPGHLVLVVNTLPFAQPSDALLGRARLPVPSATRDGEVPCDAMPRPQVRRARRRLCRSRAGEARRGQLGTCTTAVGRVRRRRVKTRTAAQADGIRVVRGPRWDPFILDAPAALRTVATGSSPSPTKLDLPRRQERPRPRRRARLPRLLGDVELVGVVAETRTRGSLPVRIERVGRPEVKNLMLGPKQFDQVNRDLEIRDLYNMEDAFELGERTTVPTAHGSNANLAFWDGLDGTDRLARSTEMAPTR